MFGRVRDQRVELGRLALDRIRRRCVRRRLEVVLGKEREEVARVLDAGLLVRGDEVRDAGLRRVRRCAAELLEVDVLAGHRLHHVGPGDEHVRRPLGHQDEVRDGGRVDRAARARPHDQRDLRHDPGGLDVPPEDLRVARERDDALLDARAARVVDPDDGAADLDRHVHHLADLLGEDLGQRAAEDREVLAEHADRPAEDRAVAGDDRVAPGTLVAHPELDLAVPDEAVELDERARVEQQVDALAREQLPALVLPRDGLLGSRVLRLVAQLAEPGELRLGGLVAGRHAGEPNASDGRRRRSTANRRHSPGIPFSATSPRSVNGIPEPATRSFTVLETTTSPAEAFDATRAPMWTAMPPIFPSTISHSPA